MYDVLATAARIKSLRISQGLSQEELAIKAGVTRSYIYYIESGNKACSIDFAIILSEIFDVTLDYLFLGKGIKGRGIQHQLDSIIDQLTAIKTSL